MDPSSIGWMYHSHTNETEDTYSGLIGPMIISRKGTTKADGTPADVDREFFTLFHVFDESKSKYIDDNIVTFASVTTLADSDALKANDGFIESNLMHSINGYEFGNLTTLTMKKGERVRWYVMGMGTEVDIHTPHWHGNTVLANGMRADVVAVFPATMITADMQPDNVGTWLFHCHVNDHIDAGMITTYTVTP
jgi:hephaestin